VLIGARTYDIAVYRLEDLSAVIGYPSFVDIARAVHPRNTVVLPGDEAIKA
jgi:hypothetical protein